MTTTLANQLPRINLANGGSMQSAQVVTLKSGQQNASSVDSKSPMHSLSFVQAQPFSVLLPSHAQAGSYRFVRWIRTDKRPSRHFTSACRQLRELTHNYPQIVSPQLICATVSETDGSNSRSTHQRLGAFAGIVLSQLRARGGRSAHLRRLLGGNLPGVRHAARNARGPRHRLIHGAAHHSAARSRGPSGTLAGARPLAD